jgi:hypothetical protein
MGSAGREGVSHKARLAGNGRPFAKGRNAVDDLFPARPKGAPQMHHYGVAVIGKGAGLRLVVVHLGALNPSISPWWSTSTSLLWRACSFRPPRK